MKPLTPEQRVIFRGWLPWHPTHDEWDLWDALECTEEKPSRVLLAGWEWQPVTIAANTAEDEEKCQHVHVNFVLGSVNRCRDCGKDWLQQEDEE